MQVLRSLKFLAVLAVAGVSLVSQGASAGSLLDPTFGDDVYYGPPVNPYGGGELLPPAAYVIDAPLRGFDNGYNPTYYWNRIPVPGPVAYGPPPCPCAAPYHPVGYGGKHNHHHKHHAPMSQPDRSPPP